MGKSIVMPKAAETEKKEGVSMTTDTGTHGDTRGAKARLHSLIESEINPETLRCCLKDWDARRRGMRESLSGDRVM